MKIYHKMRSELGKLVVFETDNGLKFSVSFDNNNIAHFEGFENIDFDANGSVLYVDFVKFVKQEALFHYLLI